MRRDFTSAEISALIAAPAAVDVGAETARAEAAEVLLAARLQVEWDGTNLYVTLPS
jgi:hypothetical protein